MNWMAWLTGLAIAFLCVVLGVLVPNTVSPLIDGIRTFHEMGLTTILGATAALAAVVYTQKGNAKLQRNDHIRDSLIRIQESHRQKKEEVCRILESGKIDLVEIHYNIQIYSEESLKAAMDRYDFFSKEFKSASTIIGIHFQELIPYGDYLIRNISHTHMLLRMVLSRKEKDLPPCRQHGEDHRKLLGLIDDLHGNWGALLQQAQALEEPQQNQ